MMTMFIGLRYSVLMSFEPEESRKLIKSQRQLHRVLTIFSELLDDDNYFGGDCFSIGDIVRGNGVTLMNKLGISLDKYSNLLV